MNLAEIRDKIRGGLIGTAMGDSLGMPVEIWKREDIRAKFGRITGYMDSHAKWSKGLKKGQWTDDTKLTLANILGITRALSGGAIDVQGMVDAILLAHHEAIDAHNERGFGKSTKVALADRKIGLDPFDGRHTKRPGNGVAMKGATIGWLSALEWEFAPDFKPDSRTEDLGARVGLLTHNDIRSITAGVLQGQIAFLTFFGNSLRSREFKEGILTYAIGLEDRLIRNKGLEADVPMISSILPKVFVLTESGASDDLIIDTIKASGAVYESWPLALALAIKYENDFRSAVLAGANAGGDTDTISAMTGALLGAKLGLSNLPAEWLPDLEAREYLIDTADNFVEAVSLAQKR